MALDSINDIYFAATSRASREVMRVKSGGQWLAISGADLRHAVLGVAANLKKWGLKKGDRVAILGENRPEWQIADFACLLLGIVDVPIYPTLTAEQVAALLADSGARSLFVSTAQHFAKLEPALSKTSIERVIVMDDGSPAPAISFRSLAEPPLAAVQEEIEALGRAAEPGDLATIIYTSGTTGAPKGAMLTHGNLASNLRFSLSLFKPGEADVSVSFLPLSHITARHIDYAYLYDGVTLAYCPRIDDLPQALLEAEPTFVVAVPRVYEKAYNRVLQQAQVGVKNAIYRWALHVGERHLNEILAEKKPASLAWRLANWLLYSKLRKGFGGRARAFLSGGAPLGRDLASWYGKMGICIYEGYGLTETSPVIALNVPGAVRLGTVGKVLSNVEAKIAADGELLVRGESVFSGYWQQPQQTAEAFEDGWFKTGDIGKLDDDGFLTITDRKKDLIKTSGGKFIAPAPLETALKTNGLVAQAAVLGDRRKFPSVLIAPNFPALEDWARAQGLRFSSRVELVTNDRVRELYEGIVNQLNQSLARFEQLKKVLLVADEFSVEGGQLTPSMKLKRRAVAQHYQSQIEALYSEAGAPVA